MNDYPPEYDNMNALEINVLGIPVAWTEDDDVYIRQPEKSDREDGYVLIGQLEWIDNADPCDDEGYNTDRLRDYVINYLKESK